MNALHVKRAAASLLSAVMVVSMAACSSSTSSSSSSQQADSSSSAPSTTAAASSQGSSGSSEPAPAADAGESAYPIPGDKKLTYWMGLSVSNWNDNNAKLPLYQELMKQTGVTVEFLHPVVGQEKEGFNLMIASGEYPDIIESKEMDAGALFEEGVIQDLTEVMPQYAPNLHKYLQANPEIDRQVKNDDGQYLLFPFIRPDPLLQISSGPIVRTDWLKDLGITAPETIDEWYEMLKAFKDQKGAEVPLAFDSSANLDRLMYAWETVNTFVNENGKVEFGYFREGYKGFLETMNKWYAEGLLDPNYPTSQRNILDSNILTGKTGATYGSGGSYLGVWLSSKPENDPNFDLGGLKYPVLKKGDVNKHGNNVQFEFSNSNGWAMISSSCKDVETAAKFLDFGYTEAGHVLYNFGIEGQSFTVDNGEYKYTDAMFSDPEKSIADTLGFYVRATGSGPFIQDKGYIMQYYQTQQQKDALELWSQQDQKSTKMPAIVHTTEEGSEWTNIMADINTYIKEEQVKFIMGTRSMDTFDDFINQIKSMNIDRAIEIKQVALDRFYAR